MIIEWLTERPISRNNLYQVFGWVELEEILGDPRIMVGCGGKVKLRPQYRTPGSYGCDYGSTTCSICNEEG